MQETLTIILILQMGEPRLQKVRRELIVLSPDPPHCLNVTLIGFQSVHFPSHIRHYTQERYFLILRDKKLLELETLTLDQQCFQRKILIKRGRHKKFMNRNLS